MGGKSKAESAAQADAKVDSASEDEDEVDRDAEGLSLYEQQRLELIERNRQRMIALGIPTTLGALQRLAPAAKPKPQRKKRELRQPREPTRHSSRLRGEQAEEIASELALFVINDECPRCGKVQTKGHKQHLEHCLGKRQRRSSEPDENLAEDEEDDEELAEVAICKEAERVQQMDEKLSALHLNGLIEFTDEAAKFVVLGSTKNHYIVTLSDDKQTCQCVDFRIRKHQCKHIRLVLTQLEILDSKGAWHQAVETKLGQALQCDGLPQKKAAARGKKPKSGESVKIEKEQTQHENEELDVPLAERAKGRFKRRKLPQSMQLQS